MSDRRSPFVEQLGGEGDTLSVELRPPPAGRPGAETMDFWIDLYHGVRRLARKGRFLFLTDNAVGVEEEENLAHLGANLSEEVDPGLITPFLTSKHSMEYCLLYAERAWAQGFRALAVLGGDQQVGPPRCVPHAYQLRKRIRNRIPGLLLGGWANPHRDPEIQAEYLARKEFTGEFWLSQIVSHHDLDRVEAFLKSVEETNVSIPGIFGVFFFRSGNRRTLDRLGKFFPVPADDVAREFEEGASPEEICARSIRGLRGLGIKHVYVSNLPIRKAEERLERIMGMV